MAPQNLRAPVPGLTRAGPGAPRDTVSPADRTDEVTMTRRKPGHHPRTSTGVGARGRAFWRQVVARYDLRPDEVQLLVERAGNST